MGLIRYLPLKLRLPLIHGGLEALGRWRSRGWTKADMASHPTAGDFVVSGFLKESLGIGRAGRLSLDAFRAAGFDVTAHDLRPSFGRYLKAGAILPGQGGVWFIHANAPEVLVALLAHDPAQWADRYRIAYWAWETPVAPRSWVFVADYLHEIWTPSQFVFEAVAEAFSRAGREDLISRLRLMPHPVPDAPQSLPPRWLYDLEDEVCEVISLFDTKSSAARKNPWAVIEAWERAFPEPSDLARLTLKMSDPESDPTTARALQKRVLTRPDMRLMARHLTDEDMSGFLASFDIVVSLHRSEGFGLPLAEAMQAGQAVIATGWSGNTDFMNAANSSPVSYDLVPVNDPNGPYSTVSRDPMQVWAEPDISAAAAALRRLIHDPHYRAAMGARAKADICELSLPWQRSALMGQAFTTFIAPPEPPTEASARPALRVV